MGLGSIALRSLPFLRKKVDRLLKEKKFDLVYFSTTQFPVCILGAYWKKKFGIPYVIDMQDPWHSDFYEKNPQAERPPKYWFAYQLNKRLEPIAMKKVDGLIAVSEGYLKTLAERYKACAKVPQRVITFGAFDTDLIIAQQNKDKVPPVVSTGTGQINIVYVGRGGRDMAEAVTPLFTALREGLQDNATLFKRLHLYFIGTSYAAAGEGIPTIAPIAEQIGVSAYVTEITDRIPFYQTLNTLSEASALFIPGSNDAQYTASKIYPYVLAEKPLLAYFHPASNAVQFLRAVGVGTVFTFDQSKEEVIDGMKGFLTNTVEGHQTNLLLNRVVVEQYSARAMTKKQCELFNEVVK